MLACVALFVCKYHSSLTKKYLPLCWLIALLICFPFNFTYNLLINPHNIGYELGEMIMLLVIFAMLSDTLLLIIMQGIGITLAVLVFFLYTSNIFIPTTISHTLPWYTLGIVLGIILSNRRDQSYRKERIVTTAINQEKDTLAFFLRKDSIKEAILAIAHEINQPLGAITNYINGSKKRLEKRYGDDLSHDIIGALNKASEQAERTGNIIHSLKNFLCDEEIKYQPYNINTIVDNVIILLDDITRKNHIEIKCSLSTGLPTIKCDKIQIELVLVNLINNACEAIVESNNLKKQIIIETKRADDHIMIHIEDSGNGIDPKIVDKLFFPFVTTKATGVGLGLSLAYTIIQRHGGRLYTDSTQKKGGLFTITLPITSN